ncbi:MAG: DNRLRE domain-containing protein [Sporichthyaceae bacterium]
MVKQSRFGAVSRLASARGARRLAAATGVALLAQVAVVPLAATAVPVPTAKASAALVTERPDPVSAMVTAKAQGSRVEVVSARTEYETTFANPDGTWTTDAYSGRIRVREDGVLREIDLTMVKHADGTVGPRRHPHGLRLTRKTTGGVDDVVTVTAKGGRGVSLGWGKALPEPVLDGERAIYRGITAGVDMVIEARRSGFEQTFVIAEVPTAPLSWSVPLRTTGVDARVAADGSVVFTDSTGKGKGEEVYRIPAGVAWDAVVDPNTGDRANISPVTFSLRQAGRGKAVLTVTPDAAWLMDPARVAPITVDPNYADGTIAPNFDAFVQQGVTTNQGADVDLKIGNNGAGQKARSFLRFPAAPVAGKAIVSADLNLYMNHSWSCTNRAWEVWTTGRADPDTTWTNQPSWTAKIATTSTTKGYSSACGNDWVKVPVKNTVAAWSTSAETANTLGLRASDEADPLGWKKFSSANGAKPPYISFTYNRAPSNPNAPSISFAAPYAQPGSSTTELFVGTRRPEFYAKASDPDQNQVQLTFKVHNSSSMSAASEVGECVIGNLTAGANGYCSLGADLADNATYWVRAKSTDGITPGPGWSPTTSFKVGAATPAAPTISCPTHASGTWADQVPAAEVECTVTAAGTGTNAPGYVRVSIDGYFETEHKITPSPGAAHVTVKVPPTRGGHSVRARALTRAGKLGPYSATYQFGYGSTALSSPQVHPIATSAGPVDIAASGPPRGVSPVPAASVRWRLAGSGNDEVSGWNNTTAAPLTVVDNGPGGIAVTGVWDSTREVRDHAAGQDVPADWALLEMQVCLTYAAGPRCTWSEQPVTVLRTVGGFAAAGPSAPAGPGEVSLRTGEFTTTATDVSVPAYSGSLSISRTHTTGVEAGAEAAQTAGVFGPGWVSAFDGDGGLGGLQLLDNTHIDATVALVDPAGAVLTYRTPTGLQRTGEDALPAGVYEPVLSADEVQAGTLGIGPGTESGQVIATFTDIIGTSTKFIQTAAPTTASGAVFAPKSITEADMPGSTMYVRDDDGRIVRIIAPRPAGVSCPVPDDDSAALLVAGCRALRLEYTTAGSPAQSRLSKVHLNVGDADGSAGEVTLVQYAYTAGGRLESATDSRTGLMTRYSYDGEGRLTQLTPPGANPNPVTMHYSGQDGKLTKLTRPRPAGDPTGGVATLAAFHQPASLTAAGLPVMTASAVAAWGQRSVPAAVYAVFGPNHPMSGEPGAADWPYATLIYTDAAGNTVNTAVFGAGTWQITAADYDEFGNVVRELDAAAIAAVTAGSLPVGVANQMATETAYNEATYDAEGAVKIPAGMAVIDVYGPLRKVLLADGSDVLARPRVHTTYDQGAPNLAEHGPYWLATTTKVTALDPGTGNDLETVSLTRTGYDPVEPGDTTGWDLWAPTTVTTDMGSAGEDITRVTRYDAEGKVIETRQPKANGGDAGSRVTTYYATGSSPVDACANKPAWAGLVCQVGPGDGTSSVLPTSTITYTDLLAPAKVIEKAGSATRTVTTTYDDAGRVSKVLPASSGISDSTPIPGTMTTYEAATGLPSELIQLDSNNQPTAVKQITTYDGWGRPRTYTPSGGGTTTTTYDGAGRVATVADPKGSTTWTYDRNDASGNPFERRGLPSAMSVTNPGGPAVAFTAEYNAAGALIKQTLPGGLIQRLTYDDGGDLDTLSYSGQVSTDGVTVADSPWLSWSVDRDIAGRIRREWTPAGAAFTGAAASSAPAGTIDTGDALGYDRHYAYDRAGRLVQVLDRTAAATGFAADPSDPAIAAPACQVRTYEFDRNGNRTKLTRRAANADGSCATTGGTPTTWAHDNADRLITGANGAGNYAYDAFGRATTIPAADAPRGPAAGNITIGYYDNDAVRTITQHNGASTTYTLDVAGRRATATTTGSSPSTLTRRYTDLSDNPGWVENTVGGQTTITRYAGSLGAVNATIAANGAVALALTNPHGDNITTADIPAAGPATTIGAWSDYDEYGTPRNAVAADSIGGATNYGWLGAHERGNDDSGLTLMGARLYNSNTGVFTSIDPIYGGNEAAYSYPGDPVNEADVTGQKKHTLIFKIGYLATSVQALMTFLKSDFARYFPIGGAPNTLVARGQLLKLNRGGVPFHVILSELDGSGFKFDATALHPDGSDASIRFTFLRGSAGILWLHVNFSIPRFSKCMVFAILYYAGWEGYKKLAKNTWGQFAFNLSGLLYSVNSLAGKRG